MKSLHRFAAARPDRGIAATAAALLLFLAMGIIVAFTNRSLVFEQRTSANQYRYTKAFEAAEAGIEWAIAHMNNKLAINNTTCAPDGSGAASFRGTYLNVNSNTGALSTTAAPGPVCVISATGYQCSCPASGALTVSTDPGPAFRIQFFNTDEAGAALADGVVRLVAHGCTSAAGECIATGGAGTPDGYSRVRVLLGVLPALGTAPAATITAKTNVTWQGSGAAVGVVNTDPSTNGITINAGGTVDEEKARITTIPGSPPASSIIESDTSLSSISTDQMFQTFFGMTKAQFQAIALPVTCPNNCSSTLEAAVASFGNETPIIWVTNDMDVTGNISVGSTTNPVILVVDGNIHLNGTMDVFGMVYAASSTWDNTGGGSAFLRGAAVSEGAFTGNGTPDFYFDADVLKRLRFQPGAFMKIPGSWKDF
jgi:PilX N-terminal